MVVKHVLSPPVGKILIPFTQKSVPAGTTTLHHRYIYRGYLQIAARRTILVLGELLICFWRTLFPENDIS